MAKYVLESEGRESMLVALRDMSETNFLQRLRELLWVLTSNYSECQYSKNLAYDTHELDGSGAKELSDRV